MSSSVLTIDSVSFAYTDSGAPTNADYVTIFAVHGQGFAKSVFKKVQALCPAANIRFVAINRRGYPGSTRAEGEVQAIWTYSGDEKSEYLYTRGREFCAFVEAFVKKHNLSPISDDGQRGGIAFLGWSAGNMLTTGAIANIHRLPADTQKFFASYLRAHIMLEVPSAGFGLPIPPQTFPSHDITKPITDVIPSDKVQEFFLPWLTSYFQHGDLSTRDPNIVEYVKASLSRTPTLWNWTSEEKAEIICIGDMDFPIMLATREQSNAIYRRACFGSKELLPKMKNSLVVGDATSSYCINGWWAMEADCKKLGNDAAINFIVVPGANHFMHWDYPEKSLEAFIRCL